MAIMINMQKIMIGQKFLFLFLAFGLLAACSSNSTNANQNALTNAQLMTPAASCNEIVQNIQAMDKIIMQGQGSSSGANYGHVASQTANVGLAASGVAHKVPGISTLTHTVAGFGSVNQGNQMQYQQSYQAQQQKQRLIGLFQQKNCVRVP
ncbi:MAG: hypothetical protein KDI90_09210 [Alphaproteobacteria bacterium]|nr:hypothetical protein [Alphaproteobacteria bacterium]